MKLLGLDDSAEFEMSLHMLLVPVVVKKLIQIFEDRKMKGSRLYQLLSEVLYYSHASP